ncbi:glycoside hydrolase [Clostridium pasteurianum]|nr:glycoside hydrolase [Clostridium pasteurianum]
MSKFSFIFKIIFIGIVYLIVFFALRIMFKDTRKNSKEQLEVNDEPAFSREETASFSKEGNESFNGENTTIFSREHNFSEMADINASKEDIDASEEENREIVYSPLIDKLIRIWEYIENIYTRQVKRKKVFQDTKSINREKKKYYNKIIYAPIGGKIYNSYYNYVFMNLLLVLIITLALSVLLIVELKFPLKLIMIIPGAVFFLYLCKLYNYLSPFISRTKVLKRHLIYINEENKNDPIVSPVKGIVSSLKENENNIEIKTFFGVRIFISIKNIKSIEMFVKEGDKVSLGEKLFEFDAEEEINPVVFFYIGSSRMYKIKNIKQLNCGVIRQNKALFLAKCSINEASPILKDGDIISLSSCVYGDNEYSSKVVTVNAENGGHLMAHSNFMNNRERFLVVSENDGAVSLKSLDNNKYVSVNLKEDGKLIADSIHINTYEKFIFIWQDQGAYAIVALANNRVVSASFNAEGCLMANRDYISTAERFFIWKH